MFQALLRSLLHYINIKCTQPNNDEPISINYIMKLPCEILTQILDFLPVEEKLSAALVCKTWRKLVDENVYFNVHLSDENFNQVGHIYQARRVRSLHISNYSHPTIPIEELSHLRNLELANDVNEQAKRDLFDRAIMLNSLEIKVHRRLENVSNPHSSKNRLFPALLSVKRLTVGYERVWNWNSNRALVACCQAWNKILDEHMPNLEVLDINLFEGMAIPPITGCGFFRLISSKPKLRRLLLLQVPREKITLDQSPLKASICKGLQNLVKLTHVTGVVLEKDEFAWDLLLSGQTCLESLSLSCEWDLSNPTQGFSMSMVLPVLRQCTETLHTIDLVIDTHRNGGTLDMKIFVKLKSLREVYLNAWSNEKYHKRHQAIVLNCNTVIVPTLRSLYISNFEVFEEDANKVITKIAKLDIVKVEIKLGNQSTWNNFEQRLREMGIKESVQIFPPVYLSNPTRHQWNHVEFSFVPS